MIACRRIARRSASWLQRERLRERGGVGEKASVHHHCCCRCYSPFMIPYPKAIMAAPPIRARPIPGLDMLAVMQSSVSDSQTGLVRAMMTKDEERVHRPRHPLTNFPQGFCCRQWRRHFHVGGAPFILTMPLLPVALAVPFRRPPSR